MKKILAIMVLIAVTAAYAQPATKAATTLDAASCFAIEGITNLKVVRGKKDYLVLQTGMKFNNFTDKVLGADKKQDIILKELNVTVYLKDLRKKTTINDDISDDGTFIIDGNEDLVKIGKLKINKDFKIGKDGLEVTLPIAMDQITINGNKKDINDEAFDKFMSFFNLMNAPLAEREEHRIVFKGTCKVTVKGENTALLWSESPINYEWKLKPNNDNKYLLKIEE